MENQQLINVVFIIAGFLGAFVFYQVMQRLQRNEDTTTALKESLPKDYVQKDDYRADMGEVKAMLKQIYEKLDGKADK